MIGVNPIMAKNNTIVTLHLDNEECGSERLAPYGELHRDDTPGLHRVALKHQVSLHELIILPSKLLEDGVRHQVAGSAAVDEHPREWLLIDVALNVQWLQVLVTLQASWTQPLWGRDTTERQREHYADVHAGR
jgi:hypothetical protein